MKRRHFLHLTLLLPVLGCIENSSSQNKSAKEEGPASLRPISPTKPLRFGGIADPQYADQPTRGTRFYRNSIEKLKLAIAELNTFDLDFVITLGDVIDKNIESFAEIMPLYDELAAPHRLVLGNHDFDVDDADKPKVVEAMGLTKTYYSESHGSWRFLYLDGTEVATYRYGENDQRTEVAAQTLRQLKDEKLPNAQGWNSGISAEQLAWLRGELQDSNATGQRVIVSCHFPVMPENGAHNLWNAQVVVEVLNEFDHVAAYLNGHDHRGNYLVHQGIHFVNFKGMVETENETAYAVVECYADRIQIDGFGIEPDRELGSTRKSTAG